MRHWLAITITALVSAQFLEISPLAAQQRDDALYRANVTVTGQREAGRLAAYRDCLGLVLVKLSGDPSIVADARYPAIAETAAGLVQRFSYRDLLAHKPLKDEQGTYDRPYELTVAFDRAGIDAAVRALGRTPWLGPRPRVFLVLGVENFAAVYTLSADGATDRSADMRESLDAAAERAGLTVALPRHADLAARGIDRNAGLAKPDGAVGLAHDGDAVLSGRMVFSERALSWIEEWRLDAGGRQTAWQSRSTTFDDAFRNAMRETLQRLAGR